MTTKILPGLTVGEKKTFYCKKCDHYTEHVQIKMAECQSDDPALWEEVAGAIMVDYNPVFAWKVSLFYGNPYACTKCKKKTFRGGIGSGLKTKALLE